MQGCVGLHVKMRAIVCPRNRKTKNKRSMPPFEVVPTASEGATMPEDCGHTTNGQASPRQRTSEAYFFVANHITHTLSHKSKMQRSPRVDGITLRLYFVSLAFAAFYMRTTSTTATGTLWSLSFTRSLTHMAMASRPARNLRVQGGKAKGGAGDFRANVQARTRLPRPLPAQASAKRNLL
eukprot:4769186-Pleurochrysis_carterae.AAC.2